MKTHNILLTDGSDENVELLITLAKKLGITIREVSDEELEDAGLAQAIKQGRTGKFTDTDKFLETLK